MVKKASNGMKSIMNQEQNRFLKPERDADKNQGGLLLKNRFGFGTAIEELSF